MKWEEIKTAFDWDGSWRDIYIRNTTIEDWKKMLDFIRDSNFSITFSHGETELQLPANPSGFFVGDSEFISLLTVRVDDVNVNCHFFEREEIEFDIDPREVDSLSKANSLFEFMRGIGKVLGKPVRLTPENKSSYVIFEYEPVQDKLLRKRA